MFLLKNQVVEDMKHSFFSILMDESTDVGTQKQAAMLVKLWSVDRVKTAFYDMKVGLPI